MSYLQFNIGMFVGLFIPIAIVVSFFYCLIRLDNYHANRKTGTFVYVITRDYKKTGYYNMDDPKERMEVYDMERKGEVL